MVENRDFSLKESFPINVNGRYICQRLTGVQRYAREVVTRLPNRINLIVPPNNILNKGPIWEQLFLPFKIQHENLLWSPTNTGPLMIRNQVVTIHDLSPLDHPEWFSPMFSAWYSFLLPRLAKLVRKIITDSRFSQARIVDLFKVEEQKVRVIPPGVTAHFRQVSPVELENVKKKFDLINSYIITVGSLEPRKNLNTLIHLWNRNEIKKLKTDLVIVGSKGYPFRDPELKESSVNVRILGRVDDLDLPGLYSGAKAMIYPSVYEGFGIPILEAMACGIPVAASHTTSIPEVVGEAGLLFDPFNVEDMIYTIERLIHDSGLREELIQKGLERSKLFTWENTAKGVWEVLSHSLND